MSTLFEKSVNNFLNEKIGYLAAQMVAEIADAGMTREEVIRVLSREIEDIARGGKLLDADTIIRLRAVAAILECYKSDLYYSKIILGGQPIPFNRL